MSLFVRVVAAALLLVVIIVGAYFAGFRLLRPTTAYAVVEETTLVVLDGQVDVEHAGVVATPTTTDVTLRADDRVRTGPDGYATITHVDGSTTTLDPNTRLTLQRLDLAPGGVGNIGLHLESGAIWNRMERLVDTSTRFEVTTDAASVVGRGAAFRVQIEADGRTAVESVLDSVEIEAAGSMVTL